MSVNQKVKECPSCKKVSLIYNPPVQRPAHFYCNECNHSFRVSDIQE